MDGNHDFPARTFCLAIREKILEETLRAKFQKPSGTEEPTGQKKGVSRFSVEVSLCNKAEKFQRGILLCFTKNLVSKKKFLLMRVRRRREYHDFPSKTSCLTVLENLVDEFLGV